jgi:hypothetical protein
MTNTNRITKKDRYNQLLAIAEVKADPELVAFIEHEKELLARKNATPSGERKPTKTQIANEGIKAEILETPNGCSEALTCSELLKLNPALAEYSSQKIVALIRQLVAESKASREVVKGKAYFKAC